MYIKMDKTKETGPNVHYKFEMDIISGVQFDQQGELESRWETKTGYCKFNKQTEEFELDKEKTDPYFTEKSRAVIKVQAALILRKRGKRGFPDIIDIACG